MLQPSIACDCKLIAGLPSGIMTPVPRISDLIILQTSGHCNADRSQSNGTPAVRATAGSVSGSTAGHCRSDGLLLSYDVNLQAEAGSVGAQHLGIQGQVDKSSRWLGIRPC